MSKQVINRCWIPGGANTTGTGNNYYSPWGYGVGTNSSAVIGDIFGVSGSWSNLRVRVHSNAHSSSLVRSNFGTSTAGSQSIEIFSGSTGWFEDLTGVDQIQPDSVMTYRVTGVASLNNLNIRGFSGVFTPENEVICRMGGICNTTFSPSSSRFGVGSVFGLTEEQGRLPFHTNGFVLYPRMYLTTNSSTEDVNVYLRANGSNTSVGFVVPHSTTGIYTDLISSASISSGDLVGMTLWSDPGTGSIRPRTYGFSFRPTNQSSYVLGASNGTATMGVSTFNSFQAISATAPAGGEEEVQSTYHFPVTASHMAIFVGTNSSATPHSASFRKNSANGNQLVDIPAGETGWFTDTTNKDNIAAGDAFNIVIARGGTTLTLHSTAMLISLPMDEPVTTTTTTSTTTTPAPPYGGYYNIKIREVGGFPVRIGHVPKGSPVKITKI